MKFLTILFSMILFSGCPSSPVRTAETLQPGEISMGLQLNMAFPSSDFEGRETSPIDRILGGILMTAGFGLPWQCDGLGGIGPASRIVFAEARCGVLVRRNGSPLALSPGVGIAWGPPHYESNDLGFEFKGFVDIDTKVGPFIPLARIEYAQGSFYSLQYRGTEGLHREQSPWVRKSGFARRLNVTGGLGTEISTRRGPLLLIFGVTRFWVLDAENPAASAPGWIGTLGFEYRPE